MKTDNLIPAAPLDRRELAPGVQLCFTRLDAPLCPPPLDWPRLLVFDFCRSGRRAIPDGAQYAIVTEGHAAVSFAVPGADFYLPGSQYEALQLFIDPDAVQADSFLTSRRIFLRVEACFTVSIFAIQSEYRTNGRSACSISI